ncbi:hypothetical protein HRI_003189400 [Hibiscus trionum]|uniref:Uncharacterized protein n=1 Tax=Hibiscus trionum TaxID=183268 RepID=A0A9W7IHJ0_HIBTR|nr:hypothetical protein HRI_003189400 [Hibiscus trionum]
MLNDKNGDSRSKDVKAAAEGPRKRAAERVMDSRASAKKANTQGTSRRGLVHTPYVSIHVHGSIYGHGSTVS